MLYYNDDNLRYPGLYKTVKGLLLAINKNTLKSNFLLYISKGF